MLAVFLRCSFACFSSFSLLVFRADLNFPPSDYDSSPETLSVLDSRNAMGRDNSQYLALVLFVICWSAGGKKTRGTGDSWMDDNGDL